MIAKKKQNQKIIPIKSEEELRQEISRQEQIKWEEKEKTKKYLDNTSDYPIHLLYKLVADDQKYKRIILAINIVLEEQKRLTAKEINQYAKMPYRTLLNILGELTMFKLIMPVISGRGKKNIYAIPDIQGFYELVKTAKLNFE